MVMTSPSQDVSRMPFSAALDKSGSRRHHRVVRDIAITGRAFGMHLHALRFFFVFVFLSFLYLSFFNLKLNIPVKQFNTLKLAILMIDDAYLRYWLNTASHAVREPCRSPSSWRDTAKILPLSEFDITEAGAHESSPPVKTEQLVLIPALTLVPSLSLPKLVFGVAAGCVTQTLSRAVQCFCVWRLLGQSITVGCASPEVLQAIGLIS